MKTWGVFNVSLKSAITYAILKNLDTNLAVSPITKAIVQHKYGYSKPQMGSKCTAALETSV